MLDDALLVQGELHAGAGMRVRPLPEKIQSRAGFGRLDAAFAAEPLEGEEAVSIKNDCVDLTPWVREDILLEFPQHPLCKPDCGGLKKTSVGKARKTAGKEEAKPSAWAELNKLKL